MLDIDEDPECLDSFNGHHTMVDSHAVESKDGSQMIVQAVHVHIPPVCQDAGLLGTSVRGFVDLGHFSIPFSSRIARWVERLRDLLICAVLIAIIAFGLSHKGCAGFVHAQQPGCNGGQCQPNQGQPYQSQPNQPNYGNPIGEANYAPQTPHPSSCRVMIPGNGFKCYGSGVLVDVDDATGLVLTNNHVVNEGNGTGECTFPSGEVMQCKVIATDKVWDLAALEISRPAATPVRIYDGVPQYGQLLTSMGYGSEGKFRAVSGPVLRYHGPRPQPPFLWFTMHAGSRQGDSGGPIMTQDGQLAGVLWGSDGSETFGAYCGQIKTFVCQYRPNCQQVQPRYQPPTVTLPTPPMKPVQPPSQPPNTQTPNSGPTPPACQCDPTQIAALNGRVQKLEELAMQLNTFLKNPPPGPRGEPGPAGPPGKDGLAGKDCQGASGGLTPEQLEKQIKQAIAGKLRIVVERTK